MHSAFAVLDGTTTHPVLVLNHPDVARRFEATQQGPATFVVNHGRDLSQQIHKAGLQVIGADGRLIEYLDETPLVVPDGDDRVWVYPRLTGREVVGLTLGTDAQWDAERGAFSTANTRVIPIHWTWWFAGAAGDITMSASAAELPDAEVAADYFLIDGTIDSLRGVATDELTCVDPVSAIGLAGMGMSSVYDLLHTVPRNYLDRSNPVPVTADLLGQKIAFIGTVDQIRKPPPGKSVSIVKVTDTAAPHTKVDLTWFNAAWVTRRFRPGDMLLISGTLDQFRTTLQMRGPIVDVIAADATTGDSAVIPIYPASEKHKISTWAVRRAVAEAVTKLPPILDPVPRGFTLARGLPERDVALRELHVAPTPEHASSARRRLAYDELLRWQLILAGNRASGLTTKGIAHDVPGSLEAQLLARLPYSFTGAQRRCVDEIVADLKRTNPMNRLLQGEVGSGKTLVALSGALHAIEAGSTVAIMAPIEALASQHYDDFAELCEGMTDPGGKPLRVELLTTKITGKRRKEVLAGLADGSIHLVVGTQALLSEQVQFARLGLVIIDEQHRFGVEQRKVLADKAGGGPLPDVLVMTATPVPRTALMTAFGDLDVSQIDELPPGRSPIVTRAVNPMQFDDPHSPLWEQVREQIAQNHQIFVVAPTVGDSEAKAARGAEQLSEQVAAILPGARIGTAHGKQKRDEREVTLNAFRSGTLDVLVATSIIEVGVNVPNSTVIVITGANNFGITQLHQLRGRVGRGQWAGTCWLVPTAPRADLAEHAISKIEALVASTDGFELAARDLQIRGAGSLTGTRQSGRATDLSVADLLTDMDLIEASREDASAIISRDPHLAKHPMLAHEIAAALGDDAVAWLTVR
ncbi:ATP-dependent DNA helicase RecG [Yimella lutea]|uniref:Probable DNA 3'-5' helicase RecG n=1 Tax=Yimella lutea TaxID=587872 RepID=A0A542EH95_9MICO|nr:ATP-dependent DNA helicase RecG [Yimella lutea]TQJ14703.1 ATP-dependent DNA helicase RecG [Yimella lutea]